MKLSLCITTFNRTDMVFEVFKKVYYHELIDEIVIVDDKSGEYNYNSLIMAINTYGDVRWNGEYYQAGKVRLFRNNSNLGMSRNKAEAVSKAKNEWVILFDSDNILYPEYLDAIMKTWLIDEMRAHYGQGVILHPSFAEPEHDYSQWNGMFIDKDNAKDYLHKAEFRCLLNNCNYVVNRDEYLRVYKYDETIKESDTIYFATLWLEVGNAFYVVPGMKYHHRKHAGSGWLNGDHKYNMNKAAELQEKIKNL